MNKEQTLKADKEFLADFFASQNIHCHIETQALEQIKPTDIIKLVETIGRDHINDVVIWINGKYNRQAIAIELKESKEYTDNKKRLSLDIETFRLLDKMYFMVESLLTIDKLGLKEIRFIRRA